MAKATIENTKLADWKVKDYRVVGSYNLQQRLAQKGLHIKEVGTTKGKSSKPILLIISTWRGNITVTQDVIDYMEDMRSMERDLSSREIERNYDVRIIMRSHRTSEDYYSRYTTLSEPEYHAMNMSIEYVLVENSGPVGGERIIYDEIMNAEIVLGIGSTAIFEAISLGKKVCIYGTRTRKYYKNEIEIYGCGEECNSNALQKYILDLGGEDTRQYALRTKEGLVRYGAEMEVEDLDSEIVRSCYSHLKKSNDSMSI